MSKDLTDKQRIAADMKLKNMAGLTNLTDGHIVKQAGYSTGIQTNPGKVLKSKNVIAYLEKYNLTPDRFAELFSADLQILDARDRFNHLKLLAEITGIKENNLNINYSKSEESFELLSQMMLNAPKDESNGSQ